MGREARGGAHALIAPVPSVGLAGLPAAAGPSAVPRLPRRASLTVARGGATVGGRSPLGSAYRRGSQRHPRSRSISPSKPQTPAEADTDAIVVFGDDIGECLEHLFDVERWLNDGLPPPPERVVLRYKARDLHQSLIKRMAERTFRFHQRLIHAPAMPREAETEEHRAADIETRPLPPEPVEAEKPAAAPAQPARKKHRPPPVVMTLQQLKELHLMQHQQALLASQPLQAPPYEPPPWVEDDQLPLESAEFTDWLDARRRLAKDLDSLGLSEEWLLHKDRSALEEAHLQRLQAKSKPAAPPPTKVRARKGGRHQKTAWMKKIEAEAREHAELRRMSKSVRQAQQDLQAQQAQTQAALQAALRKRSIQRMRRSLSQTSVSTTGGDQFLLPTIQGLNKSTRDTFILILRHIFISAPMLAERLYNFRPFNNYDALMDKAEKMALSSQEREFVAMLNNQAAIEAEKLHQATLLEWSRLGNPYLPPSNPEKAERRAIDRRLRELHEAYVAKYGFPAVGIDGSLPKTRQIYPLEIRMQNERPVEIEYGIKATLRLSRDRLTQLLAASAAANKKAQQATRRNTRFSRASQGRGSIALSSSSRTSLAALSSIASVASPVQGSSMNLEGFGAELASASPPPCAEGEGSAPPRAPDTTTSSDRDAPPGMRRVDVLLVQDPLLAAMVGEMIAEEQEKQGQEEKPPSHLPPLTLSSLQRLELQQAGKPDAPPQAPDAGANRSQTPVKNALSPVASGTRSPRPSSAPKDAKSPEPVAAADAVPAAGAASAVQPATSAPQPPDAPPPPKPRRPFGSLRGSFTNLAGKTKHMPRPSLLPPVSDGSAAPAAPPAPSTSAAPAQGEPSAAPAVGTAVPDRRASVFAQPRARLAPAPRGGLRGRASVGGRASVAKSKGFRLRFSARAGEVPFTSTLAETYPLLFQHRVRLERELESALTLAEEKGLSTISEDALVKGILPPSDRRLREIRQRLRQAGLELLESPVPINIKIAEPEEPSMEIIDTKHAYRKASKQRRRRVSVAAAASSKPSIVRLSTGGWGEVSSKVDCWMTYEEYARLTEGLNTKFRRFIGEKFVRDDATWPDPFSKVVPVYMPEDLDLLGHMRARAGVVDTSSSVFRVLNRLDIGGHQEHWVLGDSYLVRGDSRQRPSVLL